MSATNSLTRACLNFLQVFDCWAIRVNAGKVRISDGGRARYVTLAPAGTSDIIAHHKTGVFIAVEIKTGRDKLTEEQLRYLVDVLDRNGLAFVVRDDIQSLADFLHHNLITNPPGDKIARLLASNLAREYEHDHGHLPLWLSDYLNNV